MVKQSGAQKKTMECVMQEYKHDERKGGHGDKVKSRKQARAIGLKKAGASKYESKAENKRNLQRTKQNERRG
jgi:hypothetical protein